MFTTDLDSNLIRACFQKVRVNFAFENIRKFRFNLISRTTPTI